MNISQVANDEDCQNNLLNLSDEETLRSSLYSDIEDVFFTRLLPLVEIIGVLGNLSFIIMVFRVSNMRTITNGYLLNIAVADLFFIGYGCTLYIVTYFSSPIRNDAPFDSWIGCVVSWQPVWLTYFASILLITLATVEKFYGICYPFQHRLVTGKTRTFRIIAVSWIVAFVLSSLVVLRYARLHNICVIYPDEDQYEHYPTRIQMCLAINTTLLVFSESLTVFPFFMALTVNIYMYARIIYTLSNRSGTDTSDDSLNNVVIQQRHIRNQVARLLIINGIIFFCCQLPYRVLSINLFVQESTGVGFLSSTQYGALAVISRCLVLINSCVNPFVYYASSSSYRQGFSQAFCHLKNRQLQIDNTNLARLNLREN